MQAAKKDEGPKPLPKLRRDLIIGESGIDISGDRGIIIHDPVRHRFFRLGSEASKLLEHWTLGTLEAVCDAARVSAEKVAELSEFLLQSRLVDTPAGASTQLLTERDRMKHSLLMQIIHGYLSFRIPLIRPEPYLDAALPYARLLVSRAVVWGVVLCGAIGFYLAVQQWEQFRTTFLDFFSLEGAALYGVTLVFLKIFHELGHAFTARHYGCRVPSIGIGIMVLAPMLYTEASDVWRLPSRRQRMAVDAAGMLVELALAAVALLLWVFIPDGPFRSAAYFVAVTASAMTIAVNLSPFMRFDGYHMLADFLGMHSLGPRAFALANWNLRQVLFAPEEPVPEQLPRNTFRFLVTYAYCTWIYRLGLFLGIAVLVYHEFPKAIGIPAGGIEVMFFIVAPILRELKEMHSMGFSNLFLTRRGMITTVVLIGVVVLAALPINRSINVPAVLTPRLETWVFPPEPAQVITMEVKPGEVVAQGQILARLIVPDIAQKMRMVQIRLEINESRMSRTAADGKERAQMVVLAQEQQSLRDELGGLQQRGKALVIRAPQDGVVTGAATPVAAGQWVGRTDVLFHLASRDGGLITGLVTDRLSMRLIAGAKARFVSEDGARSPVEGVLIDVGSPGAVGQALTYLAAPNGGPVAAAVSPDDHMLKALSGQLPLRFAVAGEAPETALRGTATVDVTAQSFLAQAFGRVAIVFLRESGF